MNVIQFIGLWIWHIILTLAAVPFTLILDLPKRLLLLCYHLISGGAYLTVAFYLNFVLLFTKIKSWPAWFLQRLTAVFVWVGRLAGKTTDIFALGELLDLVFMLLKPNSRMLNKTEMSEAEKVFGKGINYWKVRIDEYSIIAKLGALFAGSKNMGVTTFHTINFTRRIDAQPGNTDAEWLIHELAHVCQSEHVGVQYIVEALIAQNTGGYDYGGTAALKGKKLNDFNREQQAEIAADYYAKVLYGQSNPAYFLPIINEFRSRSELWL